MTGRYWEKHAEPQHSWKDSGMKFTNLAGRVGGKGADAWDIHYTAVERQQDGEDIIVLTIGQEMLEFTPQSVIDSVFDSLNSGRHHYSHVGGELDLRQAIAGNFSDETGMRISESNCAVLAGAQNALFAASLCVLEHGDEAIVIEPYYSTYPATFTAGGADLVTIPTRPESDFLFEPDDVLCKITDKTRAIVINSPHNPAGVVYDSHCISEIVKACRENDIWLISDEVYASLASPGVFTSPASLPGAFEYCITVSSVSKSHRMTGWRLGWVIAQEALIDELFNLSLCMSYGLPPFIQDAAISAIGDTQKISTMVRSEVNRKRELVVALLDEIDGIQVRGSKMGMFVVFDVREIGISGNDFAWLLLDEYRVSVLPCSAFGQSGDGILRINIGESESNLKEACNRIRTLVSSL